MRVMLLDIETAPQDWRTVMETGLPPIEALQRCALITQTKAGKARDGAAETALTEWADHALDSKLGVVVSIAVRMAGEPDSVSLLGSRPGEIPGEALLLSELHEALTFLGPDAILAHHGLGFDFPFLMERALVDGRPALARWFMDSADYGQRRVLQTPRAPAALLDTLKLWPSPGGWQRGKGNGLRAIADALGISVPDPVEGGGSGVLNALLAGDHASVHRHCRQDVDILHGVWSRLAPALGVM